jgi:D-sedoheptulose 7-phosphate isomerase
MELVFIKLKMSLNERGKYMKNSTKKIIDDLCLRYGILSKNRDVISKIIHSIRLSIEAGGKILICGNGGSASDSLHIAGELMKSFILPRPLSKDIKKKIFSFTESPEYLISGLQMPIPAIALVGSSSLETAISNDMDSDFLFAQQVLGLGKKGDILLCITTSGNSKNVINAAEVGKAKGLVIVGLTGKKGGKLKNKCDYLVNVHESETYKVQELHLPIYHTICIALENELYGLK